MAVQLHTFHRACILAAGAEICDFLNAPDRHDGEVVVKGINGGLSFYFQEGALFDYIF